MAFILKMFKKVPYLYKDNTYMLSGASFEIAADIFTSLESTGKVFMLRNLIGSKPVCKSPYSPGNSIQAREVSRANKQTKTP